MRRYLTAAITISLLACLAPRVAAEEKSSPAGTWILNMSRPGRPPSDSVLKLEKAGDKLVGVISDNQGRATPLKDVDFKDGDLTFHISFEREGRKINLGYKAKITGDAIKGKLTFTAVGFNRSMDFVGKRQKEDATIAGLWKITIPLESGEKLQPNLRLKQEGKAWSGDYIGISGKELHLKELKFTGQELSFSAPDELEGDKVTLAYVGKVTGDTISGTAKLTAGSRSNSLKFQAQKVKIATAQMGGNWKLKVPFREGTVFDPTLKLVQQGSGLTGSYLGEQGETPIAEGLIFGDEFTFEVARARDGKKFKLRYQGKVKGDTLKGSVDYEFDGITGALDFDGQRIGGPTASSDKKP